MMPTISVLLVDGRPEDAELIRLLLGNSPDGEFTVEHVGALREAIARVHQQQFDVVVLDLSLPDSAGPNAVKQLKATAPELPLVVLTGEENDELALEAIRLGAQEYLSKQHVIGHLIARVIRHSIARQHQLQVAQTQALTDALTGIGNRRAFDMELARRLGEFRRYGTGCCVLLLDLDHFKSVNDRFGHHVGDEVLQGVAGLLRETLRETDLAARYGGEEFGVILPRTPVTEGFTVTERLRHTVAHAEWKMLHKALRVTTSAGLAEAHPDDDESSLLRRADKSLYAAKESGRNRCYWHDGNSPRHASCATHWGASDTFLSREPSHPTS
jgi:diguanylate cyclase (GGDEF)-like protein